MIKQAIIATQTRIWHRKDLLQYMTPYHLRKLISSHELERLRKGIYAFHDIDEPDNDMVLVQQFYPRAVMSLFTAASFYGLTTIIPRAIQITFSSSGTRRLAKPEYPVVEFFFTSDKTIELGMDTITMGGQLIRIYDRERVVCDMFRYLPRIGLDVAIEVFKTYMRNKKKRDVDKLIRYSRQLRVYKYISQYVEVYIG